jgi:Ran GTPase-activating protein (RanGAP) involved in mRNA processing and transport
MEYSTSAIIIARCSALSALTKLNLFNAVLAGAECADVLKQGCIALPSLRALILPLLRLDDLNAQALSENLCNMTELIHLEVTKARMTPSVFVALSPAIANMPALQLVSFMACCVGNEGAKAVGEALATVPAIWKINMSECKIGEEGALAILHALRESKVCRLLQVLDLNYNPTKLLPRSWSFKPVH